MKDTTAIVLSGGGSLGALQAGALRALIERGFRPDLMIGTSIGAVNAACLSIYGFDLDGVRRLEQTWLESMDADLLPWFDLRHNISDWMAYFRGGYGDRIRDFFIAHGVSPDLTFGQLTEPSIMLMACDLNTGDKVLFGSDPGQLVLEGMLASAAVPPWVHPLRIREYYLADGGFVSNLPVESALEQGAARIVTLELSNMPSPARSHTGVRPFLERVFNTVERRQSELELALARAHGIPVFRIPLKVDERFTFWDFRQTRELMEIGYQMTLEEICSPEGEAFFKPKVEAFDRLDLYQDSSEGDLQ